MLMRAAALAVVVSSSVPAGAQLLADSIAEFSGTQGQNGWRYGYYSGDMTTDSFQEMGHFDGVRWYVQPGEYWTMLGPVGSHPNGLHTSPPALPVEQWPARRWVSDYDGEVLIDLVLLKLNATTLSNGVRGRVFVDGFEIWNQFIAGDDAIGVRFSLPAPVVLGSTIDFVVDPVDGNDGGDGTRLSGVISQVIPAPNALFLIGAGSLVVRRRRG